MSLLQSLFEWVYRLIGRAAILVFYAGVLCGLGSIVALPWMVAQNTAVDKMGYYVFWSPIIVLAIALLILPLRSGVGAGLHRLGWNCTGGLIGMLAGIATGPVLYFVWLANLLSRHGPGKPGGNSVLFSSKIFSGGAKNDVFTCRQ